MRKYRWIWTADIHYRPIRLTQCCTQFKSPGDMILCILYLHFNVAFTFKWYGNSWNKRFYSQRVWMGYSIEYFNSRSHSPRRIIVASLVNYVPATSLETSKANAGDAFMLCEQNVRQRFEVRFFFVVNCKCCKFSTSLLGSCTWEFWMEFKKIKFKAFVEQQ